MLEFLTNLEKEKKGKMNENMNKEMGNKAGVINFDFRKGEKNTGE